MPNHAFKADTVCCWFKGMRLTLLKLTRVSVQDFTSFHVRDTSAFFFWTPTFTSLYFICVFEVIESCGRPIQEHTYPYQSIDTHDRTEATAWTRTADFHTSMTTSCCSIFAIHCCCSKIFLLSSHRMVDSKRVPLSLSEAVTQTYFGLPRLLSMFPQRMFAGQCNTFALLNSCLMGLPSIVVVTKWTLYGEMWFFVMSLRLFVFMEANWWCLSPLQLKYNSTLMERNPRLKLHQMQWHVRSCRRPCSHWKKWKQWSTAHESHRIW